MALYQFIGLMSLVVVVFGIGILGILVEDDAPFKEN
jgi:hypothetical protein